MFLIAFTDFAGKEAFETIHVIKTIEGYLRQLHRIIHFFEFLFRLKEIIYSQEQLYLVFEYVEYDLKKYMRTHGNKPLEKT